MEELAELWITVKGGTSEWDAQLASLKKAVEDAQRKGHHVEVEASVIRDQHVLAIGSHSRYDVRTHVESCDYDGLYLALGKFTQEMVEKQGTVELELHIKRTGG